MLVGYEIDVEGLEEQMALLKRYPDISQRELRAAMDKSVLTIEANAKPLAPVDRGRLRSSIGSEVREIETLSIVGRVGPSMGAEIYPAVMEFGREPGKKMPPVDALEPWVRRVIQPDDEKDVRKIAFLVARKIQKKGIKPREYMKKGWEKSQDAAQRFFERALERIAEGLSNGFD